jgi:murein DD-endopeptidase MepM/ murein hydrolase activator NlpD
MNRGRTLILLLLSPLLLVILASSFYLLVIHPAGPAAGVAAGDGEPDANGLSSGAEGLIEHAITIRRGKTLAEILTGYGFTDREVEDLKSGVKPVYDPARIVAGHELRLFFDPFLNLRRLEYDIDENGYLAVERRGKEFSAAVKPFPYELRTALVWGVIEDTPIGAFNAAGEGDVLAMDFAEIFAWDVDFYLDIRRGDTFRLVVQKKFLGDKFVSYGPILAAQLLNGGRLYQAFRYTYPDTGRSDYYDLAGGSLRKQFMKSPLKYSRITSRFTASRFHPILKVYRAHYAVDFAASVGTPVKATADGTVIFAGWNGGSGRMIKIRHGGGYVTMYLHLSRFAPGITPGADVTGGQVIGYVGASGEATGPHLDYRITHHGSYINPLGYRFKPADPLRKEFLADYQAKAKARADMYELPLFWTHVFLGCW